VLIARAVKNSTVPGWEVQPSTAGLASAQIAPKRSPVRVRLAPLGESLQLCGVFALWAIAVLTIDFLVLFALLAESDEFTGLTARRQGAAAAG
jgi:hypothetical protein